MCAPVDAPHSITHLHTCACMLHTYTYSTHMHKHTHKHTTIHLDHSLQIQPKIEVAKEKQGFVIFDQILQPSKRQHEHVNGTVSELLN